MKNAHRISWHTPINSVSSCFFAGFSGRTDGCRTILSSTELQYYIARQYTKHMPKRKAGPGTGFYDPNRLAQREQFAISNSVSGIPFRHNRTFACFCARLFVSLASPWILPLGNVQINSTLPSLIRTLACAEVLPLGKMQTSLLLLSLIRIFGRVFADVFDKPSAMPNFVRVLPRRENGCCERTIKRKKNADQRTASRPSRKLSRSA